MKTHSLKTCDFGFHDITAQVEVDVRESGYFCEFDGPRHRKFHVQLVDCTTHASR